MTSRTRRTQLIFLLACLLLIYVLFFSSEARSNADFRSRTESAIARKHSVMSSDISDEDLLAATNSKLQEVLDVKAGRIRKDGEKVVLEGSRLEDSSALQKDQDTISVAGRKSMPNPRQSSQVQVSSVSAVKPKYPISDNEDVARNGDKIDKAEDEGEEMAREELQQILKKSPIIIFSKTYCPFSKRAKKLLLQEYKIVPEPFVVELDLMKDKVPLPNSAGGDDGDDDVKETTMGRRLQDLLASLTGRKTVPNIMINAQSLGGADDAVAMDREGTLIEKIKKMGGKRVVSIEKKDED